MNHLINFISPSIEHVHFAGYWVAFFAALLETTFGIGLLLPGSTIILFLGALSARGYHKTLTVIDLVSVKFHHVIRWRRLLADRARGFPDWAQSHILF
jgi:membrane protein DedA with SNARE-associated domain